MVRANKRLPSSVSVSPAALSGASSSLQSLPAKPKENWSLREAVSVLQESISAALAKGYGYDEIAKMLSGKGVDISASSLKSYLSAARRQQGGSTTRKRKAAVKDQAEPNLNGATATPAKTTRRTSTKSKPILEVVQPEPPAKTTRQPKAKTAAPAATSRKTAAKAKPAAKTTTKTVASAKTASTRSRKKS